MLIFLYFSLSLNYIIWKMRIYRIIIEIGVIANDRINYFAYKSIRNFIIMD